MNTARVILVALFVFSCGGSEPIVATDGGTECEKRQVITAKKLPVLIGIFFAEEKFLTNDFIVSSFNKMWNEVGVTVVRVTSMAEANIGLIYISGGCKKPIDSGRLMLDGWKDLDSIIVDSDCFGMDGYASRFSVAVNHVLGELMGVDRYPDFCGSGVMSESVVTMLGAMPVRLTDEDKKAFYLRSRFSRGWDYNWECYKKEPFKRGEYAPKNFRTVKFWADPKLSAVPISSYLNSYFDIFGRSFVESDVGEAEFVIKSWKTDYTGCSPTAVAYPSLHEVRLKSEHGCLKLNTESEWDATIVVHEVAHLFGVNHVPDWCGNAIMDPYVNPGPYFTPVDVNAWMARETSDLMLK
jgi:hypothetical protein